MRDNAKWWLDDGGGSDVADNGAGGDNWRWMTWGRELRRWRRRSAQRHYLEI